MDFIHQSCDTLGRPLHDLRISVMDRCNFRCTYCMPEDTYHAGYRFLPSEQRLTFSETVRLVRLFVAFGVSKLRITGGEPLLRSGLADLIGDLDCLDGVEEIALTTNGVLLAQQAAALEAAGLDRVTVSLDSLDPTVFSAMSGGRPVLHRILTGIEAAQNAGLGPIKVNTVVQRGVNDHTLLDLLDHFRRSGVIVRLIEFMDVGTRNHWQPTHMVPSTELAELIHERWPIRPIDPTYHGEVARRYAYEDGGGEIGFISSVSAPFCTDCTRARLSSDGALYTCLFASEGSNLKGPLRDGASDDELRQIISTVWKRRNDRYSELRSSKPPRGAGPRVEMNYIGG